MKLQDLKLSFNEPLIPFRKISDPVGQNDNMIHMTTDLYRRYWAESKQGSPVGKFQTYKKLHLDHPSNTILATNSHSHPLEPRLISDIETMKASSFPADYKFNGFDVTFLCGMSVPPVMTAQVSLEIYNQWLRQI